MNYKLNLLYNSKAAKPPKICAKIYPINYSFGCFPAITIITVTAGLKSPPDIFPPK